MNSVFIRHHTRYEYDNHVFLEPHIIRLIPRTDSYLKLHSLTVSVTPEPAGISCMVDLDGTTAKSVWFSGVTQTFDIVVESVVNVTPINPFHFLIDPLSCTCLPMVYPHQIEKIITPYLSGTESTPAVSQFAVECASAADYVTLQFLTTVCERIGSGFTYTKRDDGDPKSPEETLRTGSGACRDFAVLAMAVYREFGIASRFASGYTIASDLRGTEELHAWVEVFLPGAGWKGLDPTNGLACTENYIVLSASADYRLTAPVAGTFRGNSAGRMTTDITVEHKA